jgi:hypothetical protein
MFVNSIFSKSNPLVYQYKQIKVEYIFYPFNTTLNEGLLKASDYCGLSSLNIMLLIDSAI